MAFEIRQVQKLVQQLVMTPQLQQAIKLLQLSRIELEEMVVKELQENPALEEGPGEEADTSDQPRNDAASTAVVQDTELTVNREVSTVDKIGTLDWQEYLDTHSNSMHGSLTAEALGEDGDSPPSWENSLTKKTSLEDHLLWQLRLSKITELESSIGLYIIQNLDENGYLTLTVEEVCAATGSMPEAVETLLKRIQYFDPVGVAARNLRECLLVQLDNLGLSDSLAAKIVGNYLNFLESKRYERLAKDLNVTIEEIADASHLIASLEPKPSRGFEQDEVRTVLPDVFVEKIGGEWVIYLNDDGVPRLRVSSLYRRMAGQEGAAEEEARQYLQEKVRAATWLIKSIQQRQQTLMKVTQSIFKFQSEFLEFGVSHLKPMVLRDVAEDIYMHESTVSRATANKYVHTPQGLFELKFFFCSDSPAIQRPFRSTPKPPEREAVILSCSLCSKRQDKVRKLIAGPTSYICDECVDLCNEIIAEECRVDENSLTSRRIIDDGIGLNCATAGRRESYSASHGEATKLTPLSPQTKATLDDWILGNSNWSRSIPEDEERFCKFVNQYQKDHGFSIDETNLLEQMRATFRANSRTMDNFQESVYCYKLTLASDILAFLKATGR